MNENDAFIESIWSNDLLRSLFLLRVIHGGSSHGVSVPPITMTSMSQISKLADHENSEIVGYTI